MDRAHCVPVIFVIAITVAVVLVAVPAAGQQPNSPAATLTWNGLAGPPWPRALTFNGAITATLALHVGGAPLQPFTLASAPAGVMASGVPTPLGLLDLDLSGGLTFLMDGNWFFSGTWLDAFARTNAAGSSDWVLPLAPTTSFDLGGVQCLLADPGSPALYTLTGAFDLAVVSTPPAPGIYVAPSGSDTNPGTASQPVQSLLVALFLQSALGGQPWPPIRMAVGTYLHSSTLTLGSGRDIFGGFDALTWLPAASGITTIGVASTRAVDVSSVTAPTLLQDLTILSAFATPLSGGSTYALYAAGTTGLTLRRCRLQPGDAGSGSDGSSPGGLAVPGGPGGPGQPGCENGTVFCSTCPQPAGGFPGASPGGSSGGPGGPASQRGQPGLPGAPGGGLGGGAGGQGTPPGLGNWNPAAPYVGQNGTNGAAGSDGASAAAAYTSTGYAGVPGQNGGNGQSGGSGGGGGGGGGGTFNCDSYGGGGGGGGGGGAGGTPGTRGTNGGGVFCAYLWNASVTFDECTFVRGPAGAGGAGGNGQSGGLGGPGGWGGNPSLPDAGNPYGGSSQDDGSNGGRGGAGGAGGRGGHGGGGAGGPSIGVLIGGGSSATLTSPSFTGGAAGAGGASAGNAGPAGTLATTLVVP